MCETNIMHTTFSTVSLGMCVAIVMCVAMVSLVSELFTLIFHKSSTLVIVSGLFMTVLQFSNYLRTSLTHHSLLQPVCQTHITLLQLDGVCETN